MASRLGSQSGKVTSISDEGVIGKGLVKAMQHKRKASILFSPEYDAPQFLRKVHTLQETTGFFQKRQGKMGTIFSSIAYFPLFFKGEAR